MMMDIERNRCKIMASNTGRSNVIQYLPNDWHGSPYGWLVLCDGYYIGSLRGGNGSYTFRPTSKADMPDSPTFESEEALKAWVQDNAHMHLKRWMQKWQT